MGWHYPLLFKNNNKNFIRRYAEINEKSDQLAHELFNFLNPNESKASLIVVNHFAKLLDPLVKRLIFCLMEIMEWWRKQMFVYPMILLLLHVVLMQLLQSYSSESMTNCNDVQARTQRAGKFRSMNLNDPCRIKK